MGGIQTIVVGDFGKPTAKNDVSHEVNSLIQENELLQGDNRQLRAAVHIYRSTVRELMNKCGMRYPGDEAATRLASTSQRRRGSRCSG
jgi:hypothetical protein